jgi:hypothetical protein
MLYYKYIDIDNFEIIQKKTLDFLVKNGLCNRKGFSPLPWQEYIDECPELVTAFSAYGIKPMIGFIHLTILQEDAKTHIDYISDTKPYARINIPILNCAGTKTEFYQAPLEMFESILQHSGYTFFQIKDNQSPIKVDEVEIVKPTVIRVQEPHRVNIGTSPTPRITITLTMDKDPIFLLDS